MSLPKIVTPEYTVKLTSLKAPVRFRPYLVKEEKLFLTAKQAGDAASIEQATIAVLKNCTFGEVDIASLPSFDLEYLFLQIRAKSVNEIATVQYECRNLLRDESQRTNANDDGRCHALVPIRIDLSQVNVEKSPDHTNMITMKTGIKIELRYPTIAMAERLVEQNSSAEGILQIIADSIQTIIDADGSLYEARDYSSAELLEFVESIGVSDYQQIEKFFETLPTLRYETEFVCSKCGYREPLVFEGLTSFFI